MIGLIPDTENTITFYITNEDGSTDTKEIVYEMGSLYGEEAVQLDTDVKQSADKLEDGLYVVLGNDSPSMDFMYYYDNNGVLRGEVPLWDTEVTGLSLTRIRCITVFPKRRWHR